jgi:hypothetical protein
MTNMSNTEPNNSLAGNLEEQSKLLTESYLKGLTDFVRWTSTVAAGAILWIANNMASVPDQCQLPAKVALILLAASLCSALWIGRLVLLTSKAKWDATDAARSFFLLQSALQSLPFPPQLDPETLQSQATARNKVLQQLFKKSEAHLRHLESAASHIVLNLHLFLLFAGVITYACTQVYAFSVTRVPFTSPISP